MHIKPLPLLLILLFVYTAQSNPQVCDQCTELVSVVRSDAYLCSKTCKNMWPHYNCAYVCQRIVEDLNAGKDPCSDMGFCLQNGHNTHTIHAHSHSDRVSTAQSDAQKQDRVVDVSESLLKELENERKELERDGVQLEEMRRSFYEEREQWSIDKATRTVNQERYSDESRSRVQHCEKELQKLLNERDVLEHDRALCRDELSACKSFVDSMIYKEGGVPPASTPPVKPQPKNVQPTKQEQPRINMVQETLHGPSLSILIAVITLGMHIGIVPMLLKLEDKIDFSDPRLDLRFWQITKLGQFAQVVKSAFIFALAALALTGEWSFMFSLSASDEDYHLYLANHMAKYDWIGAAVSAEVGLCIGILLEHRKNFTKEWKIHSSVIATSVIMIFLLLDWTLWRELSLLIFAYITSLLIISVALLFDIGRIVRVDFFQGFVYGLRTLVLCNILSLLGSVLSGLDFILLCTLIVFSGLQAWEDLAPVLMGRGKIFMWKKKR